MYIYIYIYIHELFTFMLGVLILWLHQGDDIQGVVSTRCKRIRFNSIPRRRARVAAARRRHGSSASAHRSERSEEDDRRGVYKDDLKGCP